MTDDKFIETIKGVPLYKASKDRKYIMALDVEIWVRQKLGPLWEDEQTNRKEIKKLVELSDYATNLGVEGWKRIYKKMTEIVGGD